MGKGRYIKAAERACSRKARFETASAAEAFVDRRYRAYRCVVCGGFHLTSGRGDADPEPEVPKVKPEPGPKLGDLDWSAVLNPEPPKPPKPLYQPAPKPPLPMATCTGPCGKDGRVGLVLNGKLIKSAKVDARLRLELGQGVQVQISNDVPPVVIDLVNLA